MNKYLDVYLERIRISFKQSKEYKINFWMMNFFDIFHLSSTLIFYFVLINVIDDILDWNLIDFTIYWLLNLLAWKVLWVHNLRNLNHKILRGDLNIYLTRPVSTYFQSAIHLVSGNNIVSLIYVIPLTIGLIFYNEYSLNLINISFIIFSWIYLIVIHNCLQSFAFFVKNSNLISEPFLKVDSTIWKFTPKTFENAKLKDLLYLFPSSIYGILTIELLKGNTSLLLTYFDLILISFIFFLILISLFWYFGLKKYEAYN